MIKLLQKAYHHVRHNVRWREYLRPCRDGLLAWFNGGVNADEDAYISVVGVDDRDVQQAGSMKFDGVCYLTNSNLLATDTVTNSGTAVPTISNGQIDFTAGTCWDLVVTRAGVEIFRCPGVTGNGTTAANVIDADNPLTIVSAPSGFWHSHSDGFGSNFLNIYGFTTADGSTMYTTSAATTLYASGAKVPALYNSTECCCAFDSNGDPVALSNVGQVKPTLNCYKAPAFVGDRVAYGDTGIKSDTVKAIELTYYFDDSSTSELSLVGARGVNDRLYIARVNGNDIQIGVGESFLVEGTIVSGETTKIKLIIESSTKASLYINDILSGTLTYTGEAGSSLYSIFVMAQNKIGVAYAPAIGTILSCTLTDYNDDIIASYSFTEGTPDETALKTYDRIGSNHITWTSMSATNWQLVERPDWPLLDGFSRRENLVKYSEGFDLHTFLRSSEGPAYSVNPNGYGDGVSIISNTDTNSHYFTYQESNWADSLLGSTAYCSFVIRKGVKTKARCEFLIYDPTPTVQVKGNVSIDCETKTVYSTTTNLNDYSITDLNDDWLLIKFSVDVPSGFTNAYNYLSVYPMSDAWSINYTGDGVSEDLYVAMMSCSSVSYDYIKTTDTQVIGYQPASIASPNQDAAGNSLQYLPGQTMVGKELGEEISGDVDFDGNGWWTISGETTISDGGCRIYSSAGVYSDVARYNILTTGRRYLLNYEITSSLVGDIANSSGAVTYPSTVGKHEFVYTADSVHLVIKRLGITDITIENFSIKEILTDSINPTQLKAPLYQPHIKQEADIGVNLWFDGAGGQNALTFGDLTANWHDANFYGDNKYLIYGAAITGTCKTKTEKYLGTYVPSGFPYTLPLTL